MTQPTKTPSNKETNNISDTKHKVLPIPVTQEQQALIDWLAKMQIYT